MAPGEDVSVSGDPSKSENKVNKTQNLCWCQQVAKSGIGCNVCGTRYHNKCVKNQKTCCDVSLQSTSLQIPSPVYSPSGGESEAIMALKEVILEHKLSRELLFDKIRYLEVENQKLRDIINQHNDDKQKNIDRTIGSIIHGDVLSANNAPIAKQAACDLQQQQQRQPQRKQTITKMYQQSSGEKQCNQEGPPQRLKQQPPNLKDKVLSENIHNTGSREKHSDGEINFEYPSYYKKKIKNRIRKTDIVTGTAASSDSRFMGNEKKVWIYVGRVKKNTTEEHIREYLVKRFPESKFEVSQINDKDSVNSSFRIGTDLKLMDKMYDAATWPAGIIVKRYTFFRPKGQKFESNDVQVQFD